MAKLSQKKALLNLLLITCILLIGGIFTKLYQPLKPGLDNGTTQGVAITEKYIVDEVVDGDTIKVQSGTEILTVRLIGINTPETKDPRKDVECFGKEASDRLTALLDGQTVQLVSDESQLDTDRYDRLLRYVILTDGTNVNYQMIQEGYAYEYTYSEPYKYQTDFKDAQAYAKENRFGLWSDTTCNGSL